MKYKNIIKTNLNLIAFIQEINYLKKEYRTYTINLDEYESMGTQSIAVNGDDLTYFDSFWVEHIPKEIKKFIDNKNIIANICRIQVYGSIMWGYICIGFIDFIFKGKSLLEHTNLFKKNKIILKYFQ